MTSLRLGFVWYDMFWMGLGVEDGWLGWEELYLCFACLARAGLQCRCNTERTTAFLGVFSAAAAFAGIYA